MKCLLLLLVSFQAWGYKFTQDFGGGFYWSSLPIKIKVLESDPVWKERLERLSEDAVGEWEARTGLSLWSWGEGTANIIRRSMNFANETKMDPTTVLAVAIRYTSGPYFARTEIVINGSHPLNQDLTHLLTTLTHELGHTMGLDHSENPWAVMAPTLQNPYRGLHNDDIEGMLQVYNETNHRQTTSYVSPLAYQETQSAQALSCGTVTTSAAQSGSGTISLVLGMLIGMVRKLFSWFKSRI